MSAAADSPDLLCAALLKVRARAAGLLPAFWGTLVQGAWLRWVQQVDPALSERLHAENQERPFTCSALWLPDHQAQIRLQEAGQRLTVQQGQVCWLRLTLLSGALFGSFGRRTLAAAEDEAGRAALPPLELNGIPFDLVEMVVDHPWGRETTLLPEPLRVFGGLARRWQRFAPPGLAEVIKLEALSLYLEERVRVEEYELHTQRLHLRQAQFVGFVGRCTYLLPPDDADDRLRRQAHLLADYAFYAGVGQKTAQGMGRARRLEG
jgi:CRISPR-associated endoribonuclease Cas6